MRQQPFLLIEEKLEGSQIQNSACRLWILVMSRNGKHDCKSASAGCRSAIQATFNRGNLVIVQKEIVK